MRTHVTEDMKAHDRRCVQCGEAFIVSYLEEQICFECAYENNLDTMVFNTALEQNHTVHCAQRMTYGDGECECGQRIKEGV